MIVIFRSFQRSTLNFCLDKVSNEFSTCQHSCSFPDGSDSVSSLISPHGALGPFTKDQDPPFSLIQTVSPVTP